MRGGSKSETITENIFREFYGNGAFIEKSAIPSHYGFKSKKGTGYKGYPDFFRDNANEDFVIIVEAKADDYKAACEEVEFYAKVNKIDKDILAIAISGQTIGTYKSSLFIKFNGGKYKEIDTNWKLLPLESLRKIYRKEKIGDCISDEKLHTILSELNNTFHEPMKIKDTERSLFFAGLMIALKDTNFRITYKNIQAPTKEQQDTSKYKLIESHNLNKAIIEAIVNQINNRINSYSKEINWKGQFAFILDIDYELKPYKELISKIEKNIFTPFEFDEKQDILGKAYKIFLSRAGKIDNKNIILTPDHIKHLMVRLARLSVDDIVLDTCTGTGGFLMEAMEVMSKLAKGNDELIERIHRHQLYGFEIDRTLFALACSNMFLHGDGRSNMIFGNSLIEVGSKIYSEFKRTYKPRKCIINPPYEKNLPIQFVYKALELLEPNGKLIIVMPSITLNKNVGSGTEDVLKMARLDFVIKLPLSTFREQGRTVYTSIFGFTKDSGGHRKDDRVLFYDLVDDGLVSVQHKGRVDKYKRWNAIEDAIYDVINSSKEIYDVCEKRLIYNGDTLVPYGFVEHKGQMNYYPISTLFTIQTGELQSEDGEEDGEYDFITASEKWKKHNMYQIEAIIYANNSEGSLGRCHYVNGKFMASTLCLILQERNHIQFPLDLEYYSFYFMSIRKQITSRLKDGTSKLSISQDKFKNYLIEYIPIQEQRKRKEIIKQRKRDLEELKRQEKTLEETLYDL